MSFYQFMEDVVRIILDLARVHYGVRLLPLEQGGALRFDFASLDKLRYALAVDIGPSTYWSELMQAHSRASPPSTWPAHTTAARRSRPALHDRSADPWAAFGKAVGYRRAVCGRTHPDNLHQPYSQQD